MARPPVGEEAIRVAILGRPNVGKSSLLNALVGQERVIVSDVPGTTRDAIDTVLERGDTTFVLVDTAGLRRKRRQRQGIEYYSELRALEAAERADVALVLIDASEGIVEQDLAVADVARKAGCSTLVVLSKWDIGELEIEEARGQLNRRLRQRPPVIAVSAKTGRGLDARARQRRGALREARGPDLDAASSTARSASCGRRATRRPSAAAGSTCSTARRSRRGRRASASRSTTRSLVTRDYATGSRTSCAAASSLAGRARLHRLRPALVNCLAHGVQGVLRRGARAR